MSHDLANVRTIEPFGFWPRYSSALMGLGGDENSPDPYYCFHTPYLEYKPGGLIFRMRVIGARATMGELALRVHAWRADGSMDAVLVGGTRIALESFEGDHEFAVRVVSLPGVIYAFFARYTQPSDLQIDDLVLTAEELADEDVSTYSTADLAPTNFGLHDLRSPPHLTIIDEPSLRTPLSQPCTAAQLNDHELFRTLPTEISEIGDNHERWRVAFAWQVLVGYGMAEPGAAGFVDRAEDQPLSELLKQRGALLVADQPSEGVPRYDFVVELDRLREAADCQDFAQVILREMKGLLRGGIGVFLFDAQIGGIATLDQNPKGEERWIPGEQDIQRAVLQIIGHGSDIAQIAWPRERDRSKVAPFGLVVRR